MRFLYNLSIAFYSLLIRIASPFNNKAKLFIKGRKGCFNNLRKAVDNKNPSIWIHCSSLGEFEQGRPLIEKLKKDKPQYKIVLSFFSPSGYEIRKNYPLADIICYLPLDTPANAEKFIDIVKPSVAIFVKYEFWYNYINILAEKTIPLYLISGIFREGQHFFKWYGKFFRNMLRKFKMFFVQDEKSLGLLNSIGLHNVMVAGDTRFDRVAEIAANAKDIKQIEDFKKDEKLFLAGSSWKGDEEIISAYINKHPDTMKWVFAPHEIEEQNIERLESLLKVKTVRFSEYDESKSDARVMIIDNIGMLSSAYRYAFMAEIGGGFGKGIHNILEAACWKIPVLFGPVHTKFREATDMLDKGGAKTFTDYEGFENIVNEWINDSNAYTSAAEAAHQYVTQGLGATDIIINRIFKNR